MKGYLDDNDQKIHKEFFELNEGLLTTTTILEGGNGNGAAVLKLIYIIPLLFFRLLFAFFTVLTFPVEVFIRRNMGERYFSFFNIGIGFFVIILFFIYLNSLLYLGVQLEILETYPQLLIYPMQVIIFAYLVACIFHIRAIWWRKKRKIKCHSKYCGDSLRFWNKLPYIKNYGQYYIQLYFEPAAFILVGTILSFFISFYGSLLINCGIGLFIKYYSFHRFLVSQLLNSIDQQLEAEAYHKALKGWTEPSNLGTQGVVIPEFIKHQEPLERLNALKTIGELHPSLQELYRQSLEPEDPVQNPYEKNEEELQNYQIEDEPELGKKSKFSSLRIPKMEKYKSYIITNNPPSSDMEQFESKNERLGRIITGIIAVMLFIPVIYGMIFKEERPKEPKPAWLQEFNQSLRNELEGKN